MRGNEASGGIASDALTADPDGRGRGRAARGPRRDEVEELTADIEGIEQMIRVLREEDARLRGLLEARDRRIAEVSTAHKTLSEQRDKLRRRNRRLVKALKAAVNAAR